MRLIAPPPKLSLSQWADQYRRLSRESSDAHGRWRTSRTEYLREIMDCLTDGRHRKVILRKSSQVGGTEIGLNWAGYTIHWDPCGFIGMFPSSAQRGDAERYSKKRLAPMIRDTPVLRDLVHVDAKRDGSNTISDKSFPGGHISLVGSHSPAALAAQPIRRALIEEPDRCADSAGHEGDSMMLLEKRTTTFPDGTVFAAGTPTLAETSRIEREFLAGDQRFFYVPCPDCGHEQRLVWSQVRWPRTEQPGGRWGKHLPLQAYYECERCRSHWSDGKRMAAVARGHWRATARSEAGIASFAIWQAYSPFVRLSKAVVDFLEARKRGPLALQVWTNTTLGEVYAVTGESAGDSMLLARREPYAADPLPAEVGVLTAGVDVHPDRLECEILGWGLEERTWSIEYHVIYGVPTTPDPWEALEFHLRKAYAHPSGCRLRVGSVAIDTGHATSAVYEFLRQKGAALKAFGVKGSSLVGMPLLVNPGKRKRMPIYKPWYVGTDTAKDLILSRLLQDDPEGHGYCHFPTRYGERYFEGLTAEHRVPHHARGKLTTRWELKSQGRSNEPLDCRVYAVAARERLPHDTASLNRLVASTLTGGAHFGFDRSRGARRPVVRVISKGVQ